MQNISSCALVDNLTEPRFVTILLSVGGACKHTASVVADTSSAAFYMHKSAFCDLVVDGVTLILLFVEQGWSTTSGF